MDTAPEEAVFLSPEERASRPVVPAAEELPNRDQRRFSYGYGDEMRLQRPPL